VNSTATIKTRLDGDAYLLAMLAEYTPAGGRASPAVFNDAAPDDFIFGPDNPAPCIVISAPTSDEPGGTLTETTRLIQQDVRIYAFRGMSTAVLDAAARRIRDLFHLQPASLSVSGGRAVISTASGPVEAPTTDTSVSGRRVTLRLELQEN
jgi:hypothetical protein